jgi:5-formyltetrahydrofolate cyclo-ligase
MHTKLLARQKMRERRKQLSQHKKDISKKNLNQEWKKIQSNFSFKKIGFYWPTIEEISPLSIIDGLLNDGYECYLPVVPMKSSNKKMTYRQYKPGIPMRENQFNIPEPDDGKEITAKELDLVFIPCVCFDKHGYRIGMGMGFYDATFSFVNESSAIKLVGLAYNFQKMDSCFEEDHDIRLHKVLTPK